MSRRIPDHGTVARRKGSKLRPPCTCPPCVEGSRRAWKTSRIQASRGGSPPVPVGPVARHVKNLVESGRTVTSIAREAGISPTTVWDIHTGRRDPVLRSTAAKLLAVKPAVDDATLVDATGAVRRLRALVVMGHRQDTLAAEVGCAYTYISQLTHMKFPMITARLDRDVRRVYEKLWMAVGPSKHGPSRAKRYGWYGPLAWDDDTIEDPKSVPQTDAPVPVATEGGNVAARWLMGEAVILAPETRKEVLLHLFEWTNQTTAEIAEQLEMSPAAAEQVWSREKRRALAEGRRVWRRVYVPRERQLKQNEMEEAA